MYIYIKKKKIPSVHGSKTYPCHKIPLRVKMLSVSVEFHLSVRKILRDYWKAEKKRNVDVTERQIIKLKYKEEKISGGRM